MKEQNSWSWVPTEPETKWLSEWVRVSDWVRVSQQTHSSSREGVTSNNQDQSSRRRIKIWSSVLTGLETKTDRAGEGQQQFTALFCNHRNSKSLPMGHVECYHRRKNLCKLGPCRLLTMDIPKWAHYRWLSLQARDAFIKITAYIEDA
jgi:hypothetical protein